MKGIPESIALMVHPAIIVYKVKATRKIRKISITLLLDSILNAIKIVVLILKTEFKINLFFFPSFASYSIPKSLIIRFAIE